MIYSKHKSQLKRRMKGNDLMIIGLKNLQTNAIVAVACKSKGCLENRYLIYSKLFDHHAHLIIACKTRAPKLHNTRGLHPPFKTCYTYRVESTLPLLFSTQRENQYNQPQQVK